MRMSWPVSAWIVTLPIRLFAPPTQLGVPLTVQVVSALAAAEARRPDRIRDEETSLKFFMVVSALSRRFQKRRRVAGGAGLGFVAAQRARIRGSRREARG